MLFLTYWFVLFVAIVYPIYWLVPVRLVRSSVLLVGCLVFHTHFAGPAGVLPIAVLMGLTYLAGLSRIRWLCGLVVVINVAALVFYKYSRFLTLALVGSIAPAWRDYLLAHHAPLIGMAPPLAISFFVFEFVHYLVDVGRGSKAVKNPFHFLAYSVFWPSIVAGPVKRYRDFLRAYREGIRGVGPQDASVGVTRVAVGLVKKFAADVLTAWIAFWQPHFATLDPLWQWGFVGALAFRILLDFSGYSDMAIGFARMHGIRLPENFRWPYLASNLTDFWRRWHISLSTWIRDYVYVALGGGRVGVVRKVLNGLLAFAVCGLWHGAGWNFLVWGLYHGVGLAICSNYRRALGSAGCALGRALDRHGEIAWVLTLLYVGVGWVFFFYPLPEAWKMIRLLFFL